MIYPRSTLPSWSRVVAGRWIAFGVALLSWGAATTAHAAALATELAELSGLRALLAPLGLGVEAGAGVLDAHASIGGFGGSLGGCGSFIGYALSFDSMLFEVQGPPCGGFRAFDLAFLAVVAMIVIAALRFRHATTRRRLDLASRMVEKGIEPPAHLVGAAGTNDLRRGLVLVSTGVGLSLASLLGGSGDGLSPAGLIPGFIGLGYLLSHRFAVKKSSDGRSA